VSAGLASGAGSVVLQAEEILFYKEIFWLKKTPVVADQGF